MKLNRRGFLKAGSAALTIPFLESIPAHAAVAQASGSLKRVLFFGISNAWYEDVIFPANPVWLTGPEGVRYMPLASRSGDISQMFTAAKFGNLRAKMNLLRGFDLMSAEPNCGGHRSMFALGATSERSPGATKVTIDNVIAASSAFYPNAPFKRVLNATGPVGEDTWRYNYSSTEAYLEGPTQIFREYFLNNTLPGGGSTVTPPDGNLNRRLALGNVMSKMRALASSPQLSSSDKQKLTAHADLIDGLLPTLAAPTSGGGTVGTCSMPPAPTGLNEDIKSTANNGARLRACMDLIYMAFNCQLTNLAVFHPVVAAEDRPLSMGDGLVGGDIYHQLAGHNHVVADYLKYKGFVFDQLLYLLNKMDATRESNGLTMLDNSLVVVVSNDACAEHSSEDIPVITFGGLGGTIKTGNYINYQRTDAPLRTGSLSSTPRYSYQYNLGRPYNSFFTTLLNALKIPHSGFGEYANLDSSYSPLLTSAAKQASLPILT